MTAASPAAASQVSQTVVIFDGSDDTVEILQLLLSQRGYHTIVAQAEQVKSGELDLIAFLETYAPAAIIWDISPPYERNWNFFKLLRTVRPLEHCAVVLTTTQTQARGPVVGHEANALEIVAKPYTLTQVVEAVARAIGRTERDLSR